MSELTGKGLDTGPDDTLFDRFMAASPDGVVMTDALGVIRHGNTAFEKMFGYSLAEIDGKNIKILIAPAFHDELEEHFSELRDAQPVQGGWDMPGARKDQSVIPLRVALAWGRLRGRDHAIAIFRDLTDAHRAAAFAALEAELAHVTRLSAMGEMSAAVAHELNQPLTAVTNYVKAAQRFLGAGMPSSTQLQKARDAMEKAADQTIRAGTIIRYLRDFVEKRESERTPVSVNQVIREAVALSSVGAAHSQIKMRLELAPRLPRLQLDKIQLQQVFLNLIRNAQEAMANDPKGEIFISSSLVEPRHVEILIRDTGPGFQPEMAGKLFHAFATTKETGLGIGLKICLSIVEAHGGRIKALEDGPGAAFQIRLPLP